MVPIAVYVLLLILSLAAVGLNIMSMPGNWLMLVMAVLFSWWRGWGHPSLWVLALMLFVLLAGEVIELLGSVVGARKFGASKAATWAALGGAIVGALCGFMIPIPVLGNIIGAILGAFLAAWIVELIKERPFKAATWAALGAALGRATGLVVKICCGLLVWLMLVWFAYPR